MPVYNGERTLRQALESILAQSHGDFEVLISDNASTDSTPAICDEFAARDRRIRYHRQAHNIGASANFDHVMKQATGRYFMWAAADDVRSPDFLSRNTEFLQTHPDFVACTSPVRFEDGDFDEIRMGDASLEGDLAQRLTQFFRKWHANGRFYALMRRDAIQSCSIVNSHYLGADWAVVLHLAAQGPIRRLDQGWTVLGAKGVSRGKDIFRMHRTGMLEFLLPFAHLTRFTWQCSRPLPLGARWRLGWRLLCLNAMAFMVQFLVRWR